MIYNLGTHLLIIIKVPENLIMMVMMRLSSPAWRIHPHRLLLIVYQRVLTLILKFGSGRLQVTSQVFCLFVF